MFVHENLLLNATATGRRRRYACLQRFTPLRRQPFRMLKASRWEGEFLRGLRLLHPQQVTDGEASRRPIERLDEILEAFRKQIVPQLPIMLKTGRDEVMAIKVPPTAPDLFIHQPINV